MNLLSGAERPVLMDYQVPNLFYQMQILLNCLSSLIIVGQNLARKYSVMIFIYPLFLANLIKDALNTLLFTLKL